MDIYDAGPTEQMLTDWNIHNDHADDTNEERDAMGINEEMKKVLDDVALKVAFDIMANAFTPGNVTDMTLSPYGEGETRVTGRAFRVGDTRVYDVHVDIRVDVENPTE